jgi:hypothetical protein
MHPVELRRGLLWKSLRLQKLSGVRNRVAVLPLQHDRSEFERRVRGVVLELQCPGARWWRFLLFVCR